MKNRNTFDLTEYGGGVGGGGSQKGNEAANLLYGRGKL